MKARERCSGERWVRKAQLERCLVKLVMDILNFIREERREHGQQFSCTIRSRQSRGFSSAKKFIHAGVEFFGCKRVSGVVVIVFGFGGENHSGLFVFLFDKFVCGQ